MFSDEPQILIGPQVEPTATVDLGSVAAKVYGGCMGLPQEAVDRIMDILQDDRRTLKACSLTCKAMFASTRHLIHQTLHLKWAITPAEKVRYLRGGPPGRDLRFLSLMGERGLFKYARRLDIRAGSEFPPYVLEPRFHEHFRSLDGIHTLTIRPYDARSLGPEYDACFTQFYPTLTTLSIQFHIGNHRFVMRFVVQFPNLENLTLEYLGAQTWIPSEHSGPLAVSKPPPLRGHLRCAGLGPRRIPLLATELAFDLQSGINFRSVEFKDVHWERGQQILDGCAGTLEEFTVHIAGDGKKELLARSFRTTESERTDSHLQYVVNWASSNSRKSGLSVPSYSALHFPGCRNWG